MYPNPADETVRILWHGHSCFEIRSENISIVIDPYLKVPGYKDLDLTADLVLASHDHDDHNAFGRVRLSGKEPEAEVEIIESFHDKEQGKLRGPNKIHIVTVQGKRIAHLGDLGHPLDEEQTERLKGLDVMLIPIGGYYTIDAAEAARIVMDTRPAITVPMHYKEGEAGWEVTSGADPFLSLFEDILFPGESWFDTGACQDCIVVLKNPTV